MTFPIPPFHLLEINILSAQDLAPVSRNMRTYATTSLHPNRKLSTRVDPKGRSNPTWNDKFVFRVDDSFLLSDTSTVTIDICALHWLRDIHVGSVRIFITNFLSKPAMRLSPFPTRFVAMQVRRPSGRPQGILNMGVALLDSTMRSMPLYTRHDSSALGYRTGEPKHDPHHHPQLPKAKSVHWSDMAQDYTSKKLAPATVNGSEVAPKASRSMWSDSDLGPSPSVVAKIKAMEFFPTEEVGSSVLEGWSVEESNEVRVEEGLKSQMELWRTELPAVYDQGFGSRRSRRREERGRGLFGGCFGDSCGCECSIFCGLSPPREREGVLSKG